MIQDLVPIVVMTGMFAMIFGITYIRSRENMAMIEKGLNPRQSKATSPRPFVSLKYGLLFIGCGLGLLFATIIDHTLINHNNPANATIISIGGHHSHKSKMVVIGGPDTIRIGKDSTAATLNTLVKIDSTNNKNNNEDDDNDDDHSITEIKGNHSGALPIYFALIAIGGGLGLFFSYRIEKKEWLDKNKMA